MAKHPKSFRMSGKAMENLHWLVEVSGSNETAVVELALAYFRQGYVPIAEPSDLWVDPTMPEEPPAELLAFVSANPQVTTQGRGQQDRSHKRKRHR